jgi:hypothetical protein
LESDAGTRFRRSFSPRLRRFVDQALNPQRGER